MTGKIFTRAAANLFFNQKSGNVLFSSVVSFTFFVFLCFFCLFVCFLKLKTYILIHIGLCGWLSDKKNFHPADFRKQANYFWSYDRKKKITYQITKATYHLLVQTYHLCMYTLGKSKIFLLQLNTLFEFTVVLVAKRRLDIYSTIYVFDYLFLTICFSYFIFTLQRF